MKKIFTLLTLLLTIAAGASATITAKWDWQNNIPSTIRNSVPEGTDRSGSFASDVDGITLDYYAKVSGAYVKLQPVSGQDYAQFNANTAFRIPVVSTSDQITIKTYPNQHNYTFDGVAATEDEHTYNITADQVAAGYVEIVSGGSYLYSVIAVLAYKPIEVAAKWTFDTGYDVADYDYTPNSNEWVAIAQVQSKNTAKKFHANSGYTAITNYIATVSNDDTGKTYYSIKDNNGDKIFSLYPSGISNSVTDYTNAAEHLVYYQFSFPTTGLTNIEATVEFTYASNAVRNLELVYSTDGGTTWIDAGACAGGANWYTYTKTTKALSAENKGNVIVRLLPANGEDGDYRMNSFTVKGKRATTSVNITDAKYATYYNSIPVQLPANLQAATVDGEAGGTLNLNWRYSEGDVIPGGTPVVLKATAAGDYTLSMDASDATSAPTGNLLHGSDVATTTTGGGASAKYYALQYGTGANASVLGFYWVNDGGAFASDAHKAWLALEAATARFFAIDFDSDATGISEATSQQPIANSQFFNLSGQRVAQPTKGLYIVNGKKVIIK